ncbi:MAG TPA: AI-2E family transporter [Methanospirillum sp.]|nr:AI-2E family transporter [Methanospirillum sp.]
MVSFGQFPRIDRLILLTTCCFIILVGLKMTSGFIGPLLMSTFAAIIFSMVSQWLQKKGVNPKVASYLAFFIFIACLIAVIVMVVYSVTPLIGYLPKIEAGISSNMCSLNLSLSEMGIDLSTIIPASQFSGSLSAFSPDMITSVIGQISTLFIVLFTTLFLLLEATGFSRKINYVLGPYQHDIADRLTQFGSIVFEYVIIRTKVNLVTGAGFGIALLLMGVEDPWLWGMLMFVLNFVPYVGFIIAVIPPTILALVEIDPLAAILVVVIATLINLFSENMLFPELAGRGMDLSPAIVFISMIFWGYFLGGSGVIVAVPLTVLLKMVLESFPETREFAMLLGNDDGEKKDIS